MLAASSGMDWRRVVTDVALGRRSNSCDSGTRNQVLGRVSHFQRCGGFDGDSFGFKIAAFMVITPCG